VLTFHSPLFLASSLASARLSPMQSSRGKWVVCTERSRDASKQSQSSGASSLVSAWSSKRQLRSGWSVPPPCFCHARCLDVSNALTLGFTPTDAFASALHSHLSFTRTYPFCPRSRRPRDQQQAQAHRGRHSRSSSLPRAHPPLPCLPSNDSQCRARRRRRRREGERARRQR
jgi:hypothetical protein